MLKKIILGFIISIVVLIAFGLGLLKWLSSASYMYWGHTFDFKNELGIPIDSLEIKVGDMATMIVANSNLALEEKDDIQIPELMGNINVPEQGYPHEVSFTIYSKEKTITLKADSFDCYNCDGSHRYILKPSGAVYQFLN